MAEKEEKKNRKIVSEAKERAEEKINDAIDRQYEEELRIHKETEAHVKKETKIAKDVLEKHLEEK